MKTLIIDNYDSYTYNLFQLVAEVTGYKPTVIKNDQMSFEEISKLDFDNVIISPGPGRPDREEDFGICKRVIEELNKPILGVCLGHQGIWHLNGGEVVLSPRPVHGEISKIYHNDSGLFTGLKQGFDVTRYHSLVCKPDDLKDIQVDAKTKDGIIMGISHKTKPIYAVQFHPESICSEFGKEIIENFFKLSKEFYNKNKLKYSKVEYDGDDLALFKSLHEYDHNVQWLDSSLVKEGLSRFSIFGLTNGKRSHIIKYNVEENQVTKIEKDTTTATYKDIFSYLKENLKKWDYVDEIPCDFQLGYIGYLGYELKGCHVVKNKKVYEYPDAYLRYIDRAVIVDHKENKIYILSYNDDEEFHNEIVKVLQRKVETTKEVIDAKLPKISLLRNREEYISDIKKCKDYIVQGESYEICLTNRMDIDYSFNPVKYYEILRRISPAPYSALLKFDEISVASSSMERFIKIDKHGVMNTKPIKGTIRRGVDKEEDEKLIESMRQDVKTKAENLMIVDLLRNDLGKISKIGTVEVPKLMDVETYSTLHQLVTTVSGKLDDEYDIIDALMEVFPGGSMTGAPKRRTLEIIDELEKCPRGVYSGAIGYISNNNTMDFNIVIRTAVIEKDKTTLGVGGAIVNLSDKEEEFDEILLKAKGALGAVKEYFGLNRNDEIEIE